MRVQFYQHLQNVEGYLIVRPWGNDSWSVPIGLCGDALEYSCMFNIHYDELSHKIDVDNTIHLS